MTPDLRCYGDDIHSLAELVPDFDLRSPMEPATNLRQDARQVAAIYGHFATHTAPLVARLPGFQAGRATPGQLYQRGRFLHAHQGSLHVAALDGPRGRLTASAYNYILRRFASLFAVRRATLRALATPRRGPAAGGDLGRSLPAPADRGGGPCKLSPRWTRRAVPRGPMLPTCAAPRS